jgi:murein DD-endopeptidase MepM/ murein hydrolase activator NlpD
VKYCDIHESSWDGVFMLKRKWWVMFACAGVAALGMMGAIAESRGARASDETTTTTARVAIDAAAKAALRVGMSSGLFDAGRMAQNPLAAAPHQIVTSDIQFNAAGTTALGMLVIRVPDGVHGAPELRLFIARWRPREARWEVALEGTPRFVEWLDALPRGLLGTPAREALLDAQATPDIADSALDSPLGNGASLLSWPFRLGQTWTFVGGPHGNNGDSVRPWTALDLAVQGSGRVLAAREGTVYRSSACPNFVRIDHGGGWQTGYYHLASEQVVNGQFVERGTWIGNTSNNVGCGGWSSGPHVHFTLRRNNVYLNIGGQDIGGWTIEEGSAGYMGCARRVRDGYRVCRPYGQVYNDGTIGSGDYQDRLDYNADAVPDVWAVNMRDAATNSTSVRVASGTNLQSLLLDAATGMPQQPAYLNTAFAAADYDGDDVPDLWVIHRLDGAGQTALRIMRGDNLRFLLLDAITALPPYDDSVAFAVADYNRDGTPDLWAIIPREPGKSGVGVRVVSGKNLSSTLLNKTTSLAQPSAYADVSFALADYDADGFSDLWAITPRDTARESVSVQIISGADWQTVLVDAPVALPMQSTDIGVYGFSVGDYNADFTPDLAWVNRNNGQVKIFSGTDFTTVLRAGKSALPKAYGPDWHILGSDRSREALPPMPATLLSPADEITLNALTARLEWEPAPLATGYIVQIREPGKPPLAQKAVTAAQVCTPKLCKLGTTGLGVALRDGLTYMWVARATNAYGKTTTTARRFTVDVPGLPTLLVADGATLTPGAALTWQIMPLTESSKLVVENVTTGARIPAIYPAATCPDGLCQFTLPADLAPGEYRWQVIARAPSLKGKSPSAWQTFNLLASSTPTPTPTPTATSTATATPTATPTETPTP